MNAKRIVFAASSLLITVAGIASAQVAVVASGTAAQEAVAVSDTGGHYVWGIIGAIVYSILGMIVLLIGWKVFDKATPFDLNKEIAENKNAAAGIVVAGIMIALGIIVAAALQG